MLRTHAMWEKSPSTESPRSWTLRAFHSSDFLANSTNSVVQTGVKSAGCEKRTTHLSLKSDSLIGPWVETASNCGAGSLIRGMVPMPGVGVVSVAMLMTPCDADRLGVDEFLSQGERAC